MAGVLFKALEVSNKPLASKLFAAGCELLLEREAAGDPTSRPHRPLRQASGGRAVGRALAGLDGLEPGEGDPADFGIPVAPGEHESEAQWLE